MRTVLFIVALITGYLVFGQGRSLQSGFGPEISLGHKLSDDFSLNVKVESWHLGHAIVQGEPGDWEYDYRGTDLQLFGSWGFHPLWKVALGYQLNTGPGGMPGHLSIQQLSFLQRLPVLRIGHRLRMDQTYTEEEAVRYRMRYRISAELPIQGRSLDPEEFFFILSDEVLYIQRDEEVQMENRTGGFFGYYLKNGDKVQIGLDHRARFSSVQGTGHRLWLRFAWYVRL